MKKNLVPRNGLCIVIDTPLTAMTSEQKYAVLNSIALYRVNIENINRTIASESMMASNTNQNGKPSKEAVRAMERIAGVTDRRDQLVAERNALAAAFGIIL